MNRLRANELMVNSISKANINQAIFSGCNEVTPIAAAIGSLIKSNRVILGHIINQYLFFDFDMRQSQDRIATHTGYTRQTVNSAVSNLQKVGLLKVIDRHGGRFSFDTLRYIPNPKLLKYASRFKSQIKSLAKVTFDHLKKLNLIEFLTPYKDIVISKPCKLIIQLLQTGVQGLKQFKNTKKEKRRIMSEAGELIISPTLRDITNVLRLTKLGQLKLLAFSDDVLRVVWGSYRSTKNVRSPFDWMVVACEQYSVNRKVPIDWQVFYSLKKRYNVEDNGVYVRKKEEKTQQMTSVSSSVPRWKTFDTTQVARGFEQFDEQRTINLSS